MDYKKEYIERNPTLHLEHSDTKTKELLEVLPRKRYKSVLDVGCGAGAITLAVDEALHPDKMVGIDISASMLVKAKELDKDNRIEWIQQDIYDFSPQTKFDLAICADVIEHVENDLKFISHLASISNSIVIRVPLEDSLLNRLLRGLHIYDPWEDTRVRYGHIHHYNEDQLRTLFDKVGLKITTAVFKPMPKRTKWIWEMLRLVSLPIGAISLPLMVRLVGGFKIFLLNHNA